MSGRYSVLMIVFLLGCSQQRPDRDRLSQGNEGLSPTQFKQYDSPDGRFTIAFPGVPSVETTPPNPFAGKVEGKLYAVDLTDRSFGLFYTRFSIKRSNPKMELGAGRDSLVLAVDGTL